MFSPSTFHLSYPTTLFLVVYGFDEFDIQLLNGFWTFLHFLDVFSTFNEAACSRGVCSV